MFTTSIQHSLEVLSQQKKTSKILFKHVRIGKEETNVSFTIDLTVYIENPRKKK